MVNRHRQTKERKFRHEVEHLENRELLSSLLEGRAAGDLSGSALSPIGSIADSVGLINDFAITAPFADPGGRASAGEVYVIFGNAGLRATDRNLCTAPPPPIRVDGCELIDTYITNRDALVIRGEAAGDQFGYAVAGVGDVIGGDAVPDLLVGAPFGAGGNGRAYLIPGSFIRETLDDARTAGGTATAVIDLADANDLAAVSFFTGAAPGDQYGTSVAGIGAGAFLVGGPGFSQERGAVDVFQGVTRRSRIVGPAIGAHLGGVPANELGLAAGFKGYSVSGVRNPALLPVVNQNNTLHISVYDGVEPDVLVGAPDACFNDLTPSDYTCNATSSRPGMAYLLSGTTLLNFPGTYFLADSSPNGDLNDLRAIVVRGAEDLDRLGMAVSSAGNVDGIVNTPSATNKIDFMFSAPNHDLPGIDPTADINNAGEVYLVFGREVVTPDPANSATIHRADANGDCVVFTTGGFQDNFRQCRDASDRVVPINAGDFEVRLPVGLILRGEKANERAGMSLAEAGNVLDPTVGVPGQTTQVGAGEILIGAPFHDVTDPATLTIIPTAGRAYVLFGNTNLNGESGLPRSLASLGNGGTGSIFDGRHQGDNYGISVAGVGNVHDLANAIGPDFAVGANRAEVTLANTVQTDVGETELFFGSAQSFLNIEEGVSLLPFVQPGPFGPQFFSGGFWSFTNAAPPAGSVVQLPLIPSQPSESCAELNLRKPQRCPDVILPIGNATILVTLPNDGLLFPPYSSGLFPAGSVGPFVSAGLASAIFLPDRPLAIVDRAGNLNVFGVFAGSGLGVNVTATLQSPKLKPGVVLAAGDDGTTSIFALDQSGHLIHHRGIGSNWYALDLTRATSGPTLAGSVSVQRVNSSNGTSFIVSGRTLSGDLVLHVGSDSAGWRTANLSQLSGVSIAAAPVVATRGRTAVAASAGTSLNINYAVSRDGHLIEYRPVKRGWQGTDVTAQARGPVVQGDVVANLFTGVRGRVGLEVFARGTDGHLIRYVRDGKRWRAEDVSAMIGGAARQLNGAVVVSNGSFGQRFVYAQAGNSIVEFSSNTSGWRTQELSLPTGVSSVIGPLAAMATNGGTGRVIYGFSPSGSLVQFTSDGSTWTSRVLTPSGGSSSGTSPLGSLLDMLADLGTMSR